MKARLLISVAALVAAVPSALHGQFAQIGSAQAAETCESAAARVSAGEVTPASRRALDRLGSCGRAAVPAAAAALRRGRTTRDTSYLTQVTSFIEFAPDGEMLDAALSVAQDRSATVEARVVAILGIYHLKYPHHDTRYEDITRVVEPPFVPECRRGIIMDHAATRSRLAAAAEGRVRAAMRAIYGNAGEPAPVRAAAACLGA